MAPARKANNWTKVQEECRAKNGAQPPPSVRIAKKLQRSESRTHWKKGRVARPNYALIC